MITISRIKIFFRTVYITAVIIFCLFIGIYGTAKAYEGIRLIAYGEYRSAIEYKNGKLEIFDFELSTIF